VLHFAAVPQLAAAGAHAGAGEAAAGAAAAAGARKRKRDGEPDPAPDPEPANGRHRPSQGAPAQHASGEPTPDVRAAEHGAAPTAGGGGGEASAAPWGAAFERELAAVLAWCAPRLAWQQLRAQLAFLGAPFDEEWAVGAAGGGRKRAGGAPGDRPAWPAAGPGDAHPAHALPNGVAGGHEPHGDAANGAAAGAGAPSAAANGGAPAGGEASGVGVAVLVAGGAPLQRALVVRGFDAALRALDAAAWDPGSPGGAAEAHMSNGAPGGAAGGAAGGGPGADALADGPAARTTGACEADGGAHRSPGPTPSLGPRGADQPVWGCVQAAPDKSGY